MTDKELIKAIKQECKDQIKGVNKTPWSKQDKWDIGHKQAFELILSIIRGRDL